MRYLLMLLVALTLVGCGGSGLPVTLQEAPDLAVVGKVTIDEPLAGAGLVFLAPDGTPISPTGDGQTDASGFFHVRLPAGTRDFRVVARRDGEAFAAEVRGFDGRLVVVSPLTNLAAAHLQTHPGETLEQAEEAVRVALRLPAGSDLRFGMVHHSHRPGFQARKYLAAARAGDNRSHDGISPFVSGLLARFDEGPVPNALFSDDQKQHWIAQGRQLERPW